MSKRTNWNFLSSTYVEEFLWKKAEKAIITRKTWNKCLQLCPGYFRTKGWLDWWTWSYFWPFMTKGFIDHNRGLKECSHALEMRMCYVVILGPDQIIERSFVRKQDTNACAGANSKHCVHVTGHGIKDSWSKISTEHICTKRSGMCLTLYQHPVLVAAATQEHRRDLTQHLTELIQRGTQPRSPGDTQPELMCAWWWQNSELVCHGVIWLGKPWRPEQATEYKKSEL